MALTVLFSFSFLQHEAPFRLALPKGDTQEIKETQARQVASWANTTNRQKEPGFLHLRLTSQPGLLGFSQQFGSTAVLMEQVLFPSLRKCSIHTPQQMQTALISVLAICLSQSLPCFLQCVFFFLPHIRPLISTVCLSVSPFCPFVTPTEKLSYVIDS